MPLYPRICIHRFGPLGSRLGYFATDDLIQCHTILHAERQWFGAHVIKDVYAKQFFARCADGLANPPTVDDLEPPSRRIERLVKLTGMITTIYCAINFEDVVEMFFECIVRVNGGTHKEGLHSMSLPVFTNMEQSLYCIEIEDRTVKSHDRNFYEKLLE